MPKITDEPLLRLQVRIYKRDKARLDKLFKNNIGVNEAIRKIIRKALNQADEEMANELNKLNAEETL